MKFFNALFEEEIAFTLIGCKQTLMFTTQWSGCTYSRTVIVYTGNSMYTGLVERRLAKWDNICHFVVEQTSGKDFIFIVNVIICFCGGNVLIEQEGAFSWDLLFKWPSTWPWRQPAGGMFYITVLTAPPCGDFAWPIREHTQTKEVIALTEIADNEQQFTMSHASFYMLWVESNVFASTF